MKTLALLLVLGVINSVFAAECRLSGSVCVDTSPSKNISGVPVTLSEVGGCWEYEDTYTCIKPNAVNYWNNKRLLKRRNKATPTLLLLPLNHLPHW